MKKQHILLLVMSIISLIISALSALMAVFALALKQSFDVPEMSESEDIHAYVGALSANAGIYVLLFSAAVVFIFTAFPGIFGLICSLKRGKFALVCLIMGGIFSLLRLITFIGVAVNGDFSLGNLVILIYFGLYTVGAALAYKEKIKDRNL